MKRSERRFPESSSAILPGLAILVCTLLPTGAPILGDEVIFESPDLRIYRSLDRDGRGVLVLTNVDEQGNFFPGRRIAPDAVGTREATPGAWPRKDRVGDAVPPTKPEKPTPGSVRVQIGRSDGTERPAEADEIMIRADDAGGTTIVININNTSPATTTALAYPPIAFGGLPGPFRYPDHQHFLGYGHGISSPSLFSGLGLNAGNRFGLKTGTACERGYDCLFGPLREHP